MNPEVSPPWSPREDALLKQMRLVQGLPFYACAVRLHGRTRKACTERINRLKLTTKMDPVGVAARRARVAELHAEGLMLQEIAVRMNMTDRGGVEKIRRDHHKLGLPVRGVPLEERGKRGQVSARAKYGVSMTVIQHTLAKERAVADGWPPGVSAWAVRQFDALHKHGPATSSEQRERLGAKSRWGVRDRLVQLTRAGHLVVLRRAVRGEKVYDLAPDVRRMRDAVLKYRRPEAKG